MTRFRLTLTACVVLLACAPVAPAASQAPVGSPRVTVKVLGGRCRPGPTATWYAADGAALAQTAVPPEGAALPPVPAGSRPRYLLAECRSYYVVGIRAGGPAAPGYAFTLEQAVPPRQVGHAAGVRVSVLDEGGAPVPGAAVYWAYDDGNESDPVRTDAAGVAWLRIPPEAQPPRFLLVDAGERGFQVTGQHHRLFFDQYVVRLRPVGRP